MAVQYIATIDATHAGFVNGNNTWYLEDHMSAAIDTWTDPYEKPVLVHHDKKKDAIGYVVDAEYVYTKSNKKGDAPQGHIRLKAVISDLEAVKKIQNGIYRTVSVTADAKYARCSVCDHKISDEGLCEHVRGKVYDGKKCFWYIGGLKYKEVSPVNMPADEYAKIIKLEERETDGMSIQSTNDSERKNPKFTFADEQVDKKNTTQKDECVENWDEFTEDDLAMAHWLMIELDDELTEDAKLSTKKRKGLSSSTFCGPNRSFPVPDCAHVVAARRLIGRYKGPGDKNKILSCVSRKAKAMGCGNSDKKNTKDEEQTMDLVLNDEAKKEISRIKDEYEAKLAGMTALNEKLKASEESISTKDQEIKSKDETIKNLEDSNEDLKAQVHKNFVDRVFALRKNLQKKDIMDLKDEKETEEYKVELAKRSDESLKDSMSDLEKESPIITVDKKIEKSEGDEVIEDKIEIKDNKKEDKKVESRKDKIEKLIFSDSRKEEN